MGFLYANLKKVCQLLLHHNPQGFLTFKLVCALPAAIHQHYSLLFPLMAPVSVALGKINYISLDKTVSPNVQVGIWPATSLL